MSSSAYCKALVVSEILGGPKFTLKPPCTPHSGNFFVPEASTLLCLMEFLISTFQLFYFPRYQGVPNLHQGALRPLDGPQRRNLFTQSEYCTISNCVFNFNNLALVVSETLGESQIYVRGPCAPCTPPCGKIFVPEASTSLCLMAFSISTFQLLHFPRYQRGPKFTLGGSTPPGHPLAEKFLYPKRVFHNI